jgi:hypothetical protein
MPMAIGTEQVGGEAPLMGISIVELNNGSKLKIIQWKHTRAVPFCFSRGDFKRNLEYFLP